MQNYYTRWHVDAKGSLTLWIMFMTIHVFKIFSVCINSLPPTSVHSLINVCSSSRLWSHVEIYCFLYR